MSSTITWQIARSSGIVAWVLVTASVVWGLLLSTRVLGRGPSPRWLTDLHRFLGGLSVVFVAVHLTGLALDSYLHFGPVELLVPFASGWRPTEVALGVTAFYLLLAVEITSLAKRRVPRRAWKVVHLTSFGAFWLATVHGITAGSETRNPIMWGAYLGAAAIVLFLTLVRILSSRATRTPVVSRTAAPGHGHPAAVGALSE
jgi:predicted ferric reductase